METYATWNPDDKNANITLSNGNLTATASGTAHKSARATLSKSSGKWYWEIEIGNPSSLYHYNGVGTAAMSLSGYVGQDVYGWGCGANGYAYHNGNYVPIGVTFTTGDILGIALDIDAGKLWFAKNGTWVNSGNPANGTYPVYSSGLAGVTLYPATGLFTDGIKITANFGESAFSYSVPSGFNAGFYESSAGTTELQDAALNLSAYYQSMSDLASFLRAHDGIELRDLPADLAAFLLNTNDLPASLSAYYQGMADLGTELETWATGYKDLGSLLSAYAEGREDLKSVFNAAGLRLKDLTASLSVTDGIVLSDFGIFLSATSGDVTQDLGLYLNVMRSIPAFRTVTAQKVSAIVHEVN